MILNSKSMLIAAAVIYLNGCATYQPLALPEKTNLKNDVFALKVDIAHLPTPQLKTHTVNINNGLDWVEIAMLAVANNPQLVASRSQRGIAAAQVYSAGLLPDPKLSVGISHSNNSGAELVNGVDLGLGINLESLITRDASKKAAVSNQKKIDLDLLWQEWQVIQQARLLTLHLQTVKQKLALLTKAQRYYEERYQQSQRLLAKGDQTLAAAAVIATAWFDMKSRINHSKQAYNRDWHDMHRLLGLAAGVEIPLTQLEPTTPIKSTAINPVLSDLIQRRPDLLALRAGYESQEQRVRRAILAQFPALGVGFTQSRDSDKKRGVDHTLTFFRCFPGKEITFSGNLISERYSLFSNSHAVSNNSLCNKARN
ncbi:MAG TPA: TolC family protein, partial [Gammaproteobacteria bacterium]|nr:TolC family protein [Gammaproteobacteria bacterium]